MEACNICLAFLWAHCVAESSVRPTAGILGVHGAHFLGVSHCDWEQGSNVFPVPRGQGQINTFLRSGQAYFKALIHSKRSVIERTAAPMYRESFEKVLGKKKGTSLKCTFFLQEKSRKLYFFYYINIHTYMLPLSSYFLFNERPI